MTTENSFVIGKYPLHFILEVLGDIDAGVCNASSARQLYNIPGKMTVYNWLKKRDSYLCNISAPEPPNMGKKQKEVSHSVSQEAFLKLQKENEYLKHKVEAFSKMIDIAETELNIVIRKKSGAKQLKK